MTITIAVAPKTREVLLDVSKLEGTHRRGLESAMYEIGQEVVAETKRLIINGPKTGRIYPFRGRTHQASAPGEAPATMTGRLARSGDYKVRNWQEMAVGETAPYAGFLEFGTKKIRPRQHLLKAINSLARNTQMAILDNIRREIS